MNSFSDVELVKNGCLLEKHRGKREQKRNSQSAKELNN
jgi:hypothetical protein